MRVRLIRPGYWTDADLQTRLTAEVREFYIGCWMQADDAGYIDWDTDRIGADLYPYKSLSWRRAHLPRFLEHLCANGHLTLLECGRHVVVPNLTKYQKPPKPSSQNKIAHGDCLRHMAPEGASGGNVAPALLRGSREGSREVGREGNEKGGAAAPSQSATDPGEAGDLKAALGDFASMIVSGRAS